MVAISNLVIDLIETSHRCRTPDAVGLSFFESLRPLGAMAINVRAYLSRQDLATSGHVYARTAPDSFMPVYSDERFFAGNPLPYEAQRRTNPFQWSDLDWKDAGAKWVRDTMSDCRCPDGIIVPCHGPRGYLGVVSLAFERLSDIAPEDLSAIQLAGLFLHERMKQLAGPTEVVRMLLTARERDCIMLVSEGRSDTQIAAHLGLSITTVATHLVNARTKLGARTRAQAVAAYLAIAFG